MALKIPLLSRMKKRERILVGLAAASAALYLLLSFIALPRLQQYRLNGELIEQRLKVLEGYRETFRKEKDLPARVQALGQDAGMFDRYMLQSDKPPLAAAELQNRVKEAATSLGLEIISEKIGSPSRGDQYVNIPVEITANGDIGSLTDFMYNVETGQPLLTVPEVTIRINKKRTFDAAAKRYVDVDELQSTMLINGMMKGEM